jgi:hypothetical protein
LTTDLEHVRRYVRGHHRSRRDLDFLASNFTLSLALNFGQLPELDLAKNPGPFADAGS